MYELAIDRLTAAGFEHYEVSNFARPGFRCRHNERYWANEAYFGFGVGAARYVDGRARAEHARHADSTSERCSPGESPTFQSERLGPRDRAFETIGTQLRRADGIDRARFREQTGLRPGRTGRRPARRLSERLLDDDGVLVGSRARAVRRRRRDRGADEGEGRGGVDGGSLIEGRRIVTAP